jgi:hypothetical protein
MERMRKKVVVVQNTLHSMTWKVLDNPPYNPELPLCYFQIFSLLSKALKDNKFRLNKDIKAQWYTDSSSNPKSY